MYRLEVKKLENMGKWTLLDEYIEKNFKPIVKRTPDDIVPRRGGKLFVARKATPLQMEPIMSKKKPKEEMAMLRDGSLEGRLNQMDDTFQEKLFELIDKKNLKDSDVYQKANIDKRLFSKIRSDSEYHPSKATVILLCLGLELEIDTALDLIARAGYSLSFSTKADVIIRYFIENKKYDVIEINQALYDHDVNVLFK